MSDTLKAIFDIIPSIVDKHNCKHQTFIGFDDYIKNYFAHYKDQLIDFGELKFIWPRCSLGNLDSFTFMAFSKIILYRYYSLNKNIYNTVFDIGANIGVDSIVLGSLGYKVHSFEPNPKMINIFSENILLNSLNNNITIHQCALSNKNGLEQFIRVIGNETASHISGSREHFGEVESFDVNLVRFDSLNLIPDLMKIDIEGYEKELVPSISLDVWENCDAFIEIHTELDRKILFEFFRDNKINIFSQKMGWGLAHKLEDLPLKYVEGYIFVSKKQIMPW